MIGGYRRLLADRWFLPRWVLFLASRLPTGTTFFTVAAAATRHGSVQDAGSLSAVFMAARFAGVILGGWLLGRVRRRVLLLCATSAAQAVVAWQVAGLLTAGHEPFEWGVLLGLVALGLLSPPISGWYLSGERAAIEPTDSRWPLLMGAYGSVADIVGIIGPVVAGWLAATWGFSMGLVAPVVLSAVAVAALALAFRSRRFSGRAAFQVRVRDVLSADVLVAGLEAALLTASFGLFEIPMFAAHPQEQVGLLLGVWSAGSLAGMVVWARLGTRSRPVAVLACSLAAPGAFAAGPVALVAVLVFGAAGGMATLGVLDRFNRSFTAEQAVVGASFWGVPTLVGTSMGLWLGGYVGSSMTARFASAALLVALAARERWVQVRPAALPAPA